MLLVADVGNTDVKLALADGVEIVAGSRFRTGHRPDVRALADAVDGLLGAAHSSRPIDAVALASVVPGWAEVFASLARDRALPLLVADADTVGIKVATDAQRETGADRLLNAFAAARLHGVPAVVVDLGTATTFDVVDGSGAYVGGAIAPGFRLGLEALAERTALLPLVEPETPTRAIARNTVDAITSGTVLGYVGLVEGLLGRIRAELREDGEPSPVVVLTGGVATSAWTRLIEGVDVIDPDLTLKGLAAAHAERASGVPG